MGSKVLAGEGGPTGVTGLYFGTVDLTVAKFKGAAWVGGGRRGDDMLTANPSLAIGKNVVLLP